MTSASDITRFRRRFVASAEEERAFFDISTSNSFAKIIGNTEKFQ